MARLSALKDKFAALDLRNGHKVSIVELAHKRLWPSPGTNSPQGLFVSGLSPQRRCALPSRPIAARSGASNCRFQVETDRLHETFERQLTALKELTRSLRHLVFFSTLCRIRDVALPDAPTVHDLCTHGCTIPALTQQIRQAHVMAATKVGIREFRSGLANYIASEVPVAVTRHGQTVGFFIPTHGQADADVMALKQAAADLERLVSASAGNAQKAAVGARATRNTSQTSVRARHR